MAEGFLGGLLGGIGDAAQGVGSGLAGLLGGGQSVDLRLPASRLMKSVA
jgi:hypothetical protein